MVRNNAHNSESPDRRLARFQRNGHVETIETLLNSINNHFNNEIRVTPTEKQTSLMFIGIHASILTIGEVFFNNKTQNNRTNQFQNYKDFLINFVDGVTPDTTFSTVADTIHEWRNIIAHQWISTAGHSIEYDYDHPLGWEKRDSLLILNPKIYCEAYLSAFGKGGKIWKYDTFFSPQELLNIHDRIVTKYRAR